MKEIKAIVFDLYGTLIDLHTDEQEQELWNKLTYFYGYNGAHYEVVELQKKYQHLVKEYLQRSKQVDYPEVDLLDVFDELYKHKEVIVGRGKLEETATMFRILSTNYITKYPYAKELLEQIKEEGYRLILLSNAQSTFTLNELELTGLGELFDGVYISSDYKVCKPDIRFFNQMLQAEQLEASDCLYVGNDHITDVVGARNVGMECIYIHTNCSRTDREEFECEWKIEYGDLNTVREIIKENYKLK